MHRILRNRQTNFKRNNNSLEFSSNNYVNKKPFWPKKKQKLNKPNTIMSIKTKIFRYNKGIGKFSKIKKINSISNSIKHLKSVNLS